MEKNGTAGGLKLDDLKSAFQSKLFYDSLLGKKAWWREEDNVLVRDGGERRDDGGGRSDRGKKTMEKEVADEEKWDWWRRKGDGEGRDDEVSDGGEGRNDGEGGIGLHVG